MLGALKRSSKLTDALGTACSRELCHRSFAFQHCLRAELHTAHASVANSSSLGVHHSLSIAGCSHLTFRVSDTRHRSSPSSSSSLHCLSQRHYRIKYNRFSKRQHGLSPTWNKKDVKRIEYDSSLSLDDAFPASTKDTAAPNHPYKEKKRFDFEYLEFLKQKYRRAQSGQRVRRRGTQRPPNTSGKRPFSSSSSSSSDTAAAAARLAAQQQRIMAREDEINPTSVGGVLVMAIGAAIFYWLYHIDNTKHAGISSFLSQFSRAPSLPDLIAKNEARPLRLIPDDWSALRVVMEHCKQAALSLYDSSAYYNSEFIWSKLFRLFYVPSHKLLPPTKQNVYTLVLDLDTVCHSTWSRRQGYERTMRPFYSEFVARMFESGWEIVVFGHCEDYDWMESPDMAKLDGKGMVANYLWNKDCYYFNGHRCKDLSRLGRDLRHVIVIDSDARSIQMQPENGIVLQRWTPPTPTESDADGDVEDKENALLQLIEFLEYLAKAEVADVRQVLAAYRGKDIAQEFRKRYFAAVKAQLLQQQEEENENASEEEGEDSYDEEEEAYEQPRQLDQQRVQLA